MQTAPVAPSEHEAETLLVFSDVHLGSDLNEQPGIPRRSRLVDQDLIHLLEHYRRRKPASGARWRIVVAGDFIDFIGMTIPVRRGAERASGPDGERLDTEPSAEELEHGLGNADDHARIKLRRVVARHADVFDALAAFVAAGHALSFVHGNHDLEFYWEGVRAELKEILHARASLLPELAGAPIDRATFEARIEFCPWFYYQGGLAYIEHGHQYDAFCATDHVMAPLAPGDQRRIARGFSDVLLRFVVRRTTGLREHGHENMGMMDYVHFGVRLGVRGMATLAVRFTRAVVELFRLRREYFTEAAVALRAEHERRIALLGEATRLGLDRLRALAALQVPPVQRSIRGILASVLLDRLALALAAALVLLVAGGIGAHYGYFWATAACVLVAWGVAHRHLAKQRQLDPADQMVERASHLVRLFPAAFVVMGHTHSPVETKLAEGDATYFNVGSWAEAEAEPSGHSYRAARTHLVLYRREGKPVAEFYTWDSADGPKPYAQTRV